ncbi:MAG: aldehyde ferredoxin oxidoreductase C-terminal domain-containing protein [Nitrososphaerota archaeon]|nr:aldehyde ferredoxin oxidoreductase [Candidatus Bathyarchaeota archaeon]MDW8048114.1 aldehyde ferredoxin oxidoreductase C-terminal domain-containing protein [Nitrososphaerota archaeon]
MRGYAGKILEVDLSSNSIKETSFGDDILRQYIGGRGLAAKILWDQLGERWEEIDPLGPENILLALTGPLSGFFLGARICISGKSPQSNGIVGSTLGGEFPIELKCAGFDGIIVKGGSEKPVYLLVTDQELEIVDAAHVWGRGGKETVAILSREVRERIGKRMERRGLAKEPAVIYIGPAGEKMSRLAAVCTKWTHAAGYGGYGAVMGSKNLKAIVAKGSGPLPDVEDIERVRGLIEESSKILMRNVRMRRWGTGSAGYEVGARQSSEPVRNWQDEWHDEKSFGVTEFEDRLWIKRYWGDFGCPLTCLKIAYIKTGQYKGAVTDNPDYELQAYAGPNLGIFRPEDNVYLVSLIDDLGFCGIQAGNALGFAAELYQRGILTKDDLGGIDLRWGKTDAFAALLRDIAFRKGVGDILAEGTYRAAKALGKIKGVDLSSYAIVEKGIAIGAHGIRSGKDYPIEISYACSVQGGDHSSTAYLPLNHPNSEFRMIFSDSAVLCVFNTFGLPEEIVWNFYESVTGWRIEPQEWFGTMARRILHIQRAALLIGGPDLRWDPKIHDDNPPRFYEPLQSGPCSGRKIDRKRFEEMRMEYYEEVGWDENGVPKGEELERLGLIEVSKKLEMMGLYGS